MQVLRSIETLMNKYFNQISIFSLLQLCIVCLHNDVDNIYKGVISWLIPILLGFYVKATNLFKGSPWKPYIYPPCKGATMLKQHQSISDMQDLQFIWLFKYTLFVIEELRYADIRKLVGYYLIMLKCNVRRGVIRLITGFVKYVNNNKNRLTSLK